MGRLANVSPPECFSRGIQARISSGFPLKACGNDGMVVIGVKTFKSPVGKSLAL
jgi:hypothetical protein